jgi:hypothetical protein
MVDVQRVTQFTACQQWINLESSDCLSRMATSLPAPQPRRDSWCGAGEGESRANLQCVVGEQPPNPWCCAMAVARCSKNGRRRPPRQRRRRRGRGRGNAAAAAAAGESVGGRRLVLADLGRAPTAALPVAAPL